MKYKKVAEQYDEIYSKDADAFGTEHLPLVRALTEVLKGGKVLEIGAGAGRNALFLASQGFDVLATDLSPVSVKLITTRAKAQNITLRAEMLDIASAELVEEYDAIICTFTLHHLERADALTALSKIQTHTKPGGFNALTVFTKEGDFYTSEKGTPYFYLEGKAELEQIYAGWKLHKSFERSGPARNPDGEGKKQTNTFAGLLAERTI